MSRKYLTLLIVSCLGFLHLPFIEADPDINVCISGRGAWTDEGLNTSQVRNFVNHGYLSMDECDNLIKTPYFGFILVPFYTLLGTDIWVGRLLVLGCSLIVLLLFLRHRPTRLFALTFGIIGLLQFHVFHFSHYSLAEMMGVAWIMLGIYLLWRSEHYHKIWLTIASAACFSLAYYTKVTFAYAIAIPIAAQLSVYIKRRIKNEAIEKPLWKELLASTGVGSFLALVFYLKWYIPNLKVFDMVRANQGTDRFDMHDIWNRVDFNINTHLFDYGIGIFTWVIPVILVLIFFLKTSNNKKDVLLYGFLIWFTAELHRLVIVNPPTRYLIPLLASGLALTAFVLSEHGMKGRMRFIIYPTIAVLGLYNLTNYWKSLNARTYQTAEVRHYLSEFDLKDETIIGVWGTGLASGTQARCIPIWHEFNPKENPISAYRPRIVFSEHDQVDSGDAYRLRSINLEAESDSVKQFTVYDYKVNLYWMNPN